MDNERNMSTGGYTGSDSSSTYEGSGREEGMGGESMRSSGRNQGMGGDSMHGSSRGDSDQRHSQGGTNDMGRSQSTNMREDSEEDSWNSGR